MLHCFISCLDNWIKIRCTGCRSSFPDWLFVYEKRVACSKHAQSFDSRKTKHRTPEIRLNPCFFYLSRLKKMSIESTDECMEAHSRAGSSYECCTKSGMTLRCSVGKLNRFWSERSKHKKNHQHAKSSKITNFRAGSGAVIVTFTKCWSHKCNCATCAKKIDQLSFWYEPTCLCYDFELHK